MYSKTIPSAKTSASAAVPTGRLIYLDVIRAVAILLVLGYHQIVELQPQHYAHALLRYWGIIGWTGVDLFFVLSGFLIGGLLLNEYQQRGQIHIGRFYIRRGFKIWPSYVVFILTITAYIAVFHRHSAALGTDGWKDIPALMWPYFLQVQNYHAPLHTMIVHTWSLSVEEHFYLILPLVLLLCLRKGIARGPEALAAIPWIYLLTAVVCLGWRILNYCLVRDFTLNWYYFPTHLRIDSLMAGVFLAYMVRFRPAALAPLRRHRWTLLLCSIACYLPNVLFERDSAPFLQTGGFTVLALGSMGFILLAWFADGDLAAGRSAPGTPAAAPPLARFLAWIGLYSYSIYLWHLPFQSLLFKKVIERFDLADRPWIALPALLLYICVTIAFGMIMYRIIERPSLALRDRLFPSRSSAVGPAAHADALNVDRPQGLPMHGLAHAPSREA